MCRCCLPFLYSLLQIFLVVFLLPVSASSVQYSILNVQSPPELSGDYLGVFAAFNRQIPRQSSAVESSLILAATNDPPSSSSFASYSGCPPFNPSVNYSSDIVVVTRANCTFFDKIDFIEDHGGGAVIVVNSDNDVIVMGAGAGNISDIPAIMIGYSHGSVLIDALKKGKDIKASIFLYERPLFDGSFIITFFLSVAIVYGAAHYSADKKKISAPILGSEHVSDAVEYEEGLDADHEIAYLDDRAAYSFVVVASFGLLVLFFFLDKLIYVLLGVFCLAGIQGLMACMSSLIYYISSRFGYRSQLKRCVLTPHTRCGKISLVSLITFVLSSIIALLWLIYRKHRYSYIPQNLMSISILFMIQRVVRLPSIRVSSILLTLAFLYDIFWVFLSPFFFRESVMVAVATGGNSGESIPMLIRIPRFNDRLGGDSLLGLGDIALPGLFVSFLLRYDKYKQYTSWKQGYFVIVLFGYAIGILCTYIGLMAMRSGQPALLYIVPSTLGLILIVSHRRGDLKEMWDGMGEAERAANGGGTEVNAARPLMASSAPIYDNNEYSVNVSASYVSGERRSSSEVNVGMAQRGGRIPTEEV